MCLIEAIGVLFREGVDSRLGSKFPSRIASFQVNLTKKHDVGKIEWLERMFPEK